MDCPGRNTILASNRCSGGIRPYISKHLFCEFCLIIINTVSTYFLACMLHKSIKTDALNDFIAFII